MVKGAALWAFVGLGCASLVAASLFMPVDGVRPSAPRGIAATPATSPAASDVETQSATPTASVEAPLLVKEPAATPAGMAWIPGGEFRMGSDEASVDNPDRIKLDEFPAHQVALDGYWIDS